MTFENTAWAIDGALLGSSLARRAEFAATSGAQGVVQKGDLKVNAFTVPGIGFQIEPGVGLVVNNYQDAPNETYVVSNPGVHVFPSSAMPPAQTFAQSFLIAVVVGDPDFSQTGHPWMGSDDPPVGEEQSFEYVRPTLVAVEPGATELPPDYPGLVLARLDIPANTTTIISDYIIDLRKLARPRQEQQIFVGSPWTNAAPVRIPAGTNFGGWGDAEFSPAVKVPKWATRAIIVTSINGVRLADTSANVSGNIRTRIGTVNGSNTAFDYSTGGGGIRDNLQTAGEFDVTSLAGTTVNLKVQGFQNVPGAPSNAQKLTLQAGSQQIFDVRFFEE